MISARWTSGEEEGELLDEDRGGLPGVSHAWVAGSEAGRRGTRAAAREESPGTDALGYYLRTIGRLRLLRPDEEHELALRSAAGEAEASARLVEWNLRLVVSVAKRYQGMGLSLADLIAEGNLGLIRAVERFDPHRGVRLSTYATKWIRQAITRSLANHARTVRLPANVVELVRQYRAREQAIMQQRGGPARPEDVCQGTPLSRERWAEMINASATPVSLDLPVTESGGRRLYEVLSREGEDSPLDLLSRDVEQSRLYRFLAKLPERERRILAYRYGIEDGEAHSLEETGKIFGVTRERIRQLEERALRRMREMAAERDRGGQPPLR